MGKEKLIREQDRATKLASFDAKRVSFAPYLASFVALCTGLDAEIFPDAARALFKTRQDLREDARKRNVAFKYELDDPAHEKTWSDSLRTAPNGSVNARLKMIRTELLKEWSYPDKDFPSPAGETPAAQAIREAEQIEHKEAQDLIMAKHMGGRTKLVLEKLRSSVFGADITIVRDIRREGLRAILCTDLISNYLCGKAEGVKARILSLPGIRIFIVPWNQF